MYYLSESLCFSVSLACVQEGDVTFWDIFDSGLIHTLAHESGILYLSSLT